MSDKNSSLWAIIESRDASIAIIQKLLLEKQKDLIEKETALLRVTESLEEKETALLRVTESLEEKETALLRLTKSLEEKEAVIHTQHEALLQLTKSLEEKETVTHAQHETLLLQTKSLGEKEAVIQELRRVVAAYRSPFVILRYITLSVNRTVSAAQNIKGWSQSILAHRLGNLIQHEPRELRLPTRYARPVHVTQPPKISIVTPSFNQAGFIERTLKSVLDQNYSNLEYFVQDGGSTDGTHKILGRYGDQLTGWDCRSDNGQAEAINLGFARTTGEIMGWLNSDDILLPGALAYVANHFKRHPEVDVVYGHRILIDDNDQQIGRWMLPAHDDEVLSWADYIPQETMFWRRRIWDKSGGRLDESFLFAMDWDLLVRFREAGARFSRLPRFLGGFRIHTQQKTSAEILGIGVQEMNRIRQRLLGRVPSDTEIYKAVLPYMRKHVATDLWWRIRRVMNIHY